jgi:Tfp pilus assembly protein PilO
VAKFAYDIGRLDRIINVENIQIGGSHKDGDNIVITAHCLATTFHAIDRGKK